MSASKMILVLILFVSLGCDASSLDMFELDRIQYGVFISGQPVLKDDTQPKPDSLVSLTNKLGQKYHCLIPEIDHPADVSNGATKDGLTPDRPTLADFTSQIRTALLPMTSMCLMKTKDWWTYEICPGKLIRQYHLEGKIYQ